MRQRRTFRSAAEQEDMLKRRLERGYLKKAHTFTTASDLLKGFWGKSGVKEDRVAILNAVWDKEIGSYKTHWKLAGVKGGTVHVNVRSSASGQELALRSKELVRNLNKHFRIQWIKAVRFRVSA